MTFDSFTKGLLDRFQRSLPTYWQEHAADYEIAFPEKWDAQNFLNRLASGLQDPFRSQLRSIPSKLFMAEVVGTYALPTDFTQRAVSANEYAARQWWLERYLQPARAGVEFTMINRLTELLVRTTPHLALALRATYPHVFVDEFQDTTAAQFELLKTAFQHERVTTTVVGDDKQRIMKFAGAMDNAMDNFDAEFSAKHFDLLWNFRSSNDLVTAQHAVALRINESVPKSVSKAKPEVGHVPISLWAFPDLEAQATGLAKWIADDMEISDRAGEDFVVLSRSKIGNFQPSLQTAFDTCGISVRNDDAQYGALKLQDLLAHDVTRFALGLLRLAVTTRGLPEVWLECQRTLTRLRGEPRSDRAARSLADELQRWTVDLGKWLGDQNPDETPAASVLERALGIVSSEQLSSFVRGANAGDSLDLVRQALQLRMDDARSVSGTTWAQVFERFLSQDAVRMMTIHRSKGLEFHTVFVLGLDRSTWFGLRDDPESELSAFFVGLSRAARRVVFCTIDRRARDGDVRPFYDLLEAGGALTKEW